MQTSDRLVTLGLLLIGAVTAILTLTLHGPVWLAAVLGLAFLALAVVRSRRSFDGAIDTMTDEFEELRKSQKI